MAAASPGMKGTQQRTSTAVSAPIAPTIAKAARQPSHSPIAATIGTPSRVAMVSPRNTLATACARFSRGTSPAATSAATPK